MKVVGLTMAVLLALTTGVHAKSPHSLVNDAAVVLREIAEQPDNAPLKYLLNNAHGVAIFPEVIRVGLGLGGRYGEGLLLRRDPVTNSWYGPYFIDIKGLSYGFQVGIQSTSLVLVITNERGLTNLRDGTVTLGGSMSVAAGPVGRSAEAATDIDLEASIYSYSISRGVFAGLSLEGAVISSNTGSNRVYWQAELTPEEILEKEVDTLEAVSLVEAIMGIMQEK
ncbi:MAG: lipid-binding SYLF domain-containing protein [Firmicutes bacterium]|nr:lipid-binding SYLF domain-containing protein [Bacillota bacterium]